MKKSMLISTAAACAFATMAHAHPGSNILTTGSKSPRAATTPGMSYESVGGVHVFRGSPRVTKEALLAPPRKPRIEIEINIEREPFRRIRRLRTQGFYSGNIYPSRPFTQGFYSGTPY